MSYLVARVGDAVRLGGVTGVVEQQQTAEDPGVTNRECVVRWPDGATSIVHADTLEVARGKAALPVMFPSQPTTHERGGTL
jgi:hypothetical protein